MIIKRTFSNLIRKPALIPENRILILLDHLKWDV
jgi:hypothetical protein